MMEVTIFGSDYGESIVICYPSARGIECGVVDCYSRNHPPHLNPVLQHLHRRVGRGPLAFVIATHPHDDHIRGLGQILEEFGQRIEFFGWWGGVGMTYTKVYFERLERQYRLRGHGHALGISSKSVTRILDAIHEHPISRVQDSTDGLPCPFYETPKRRAGSVPFRIKALSPWLPLQSAYLRRLVGGVELDGHIEEHRAAINQTSLGLLIEYGDARIILGGDVEFENWNYAFERGALRGFRGAHLVKLPHHGSRTGMQPDLWTRVAPFVAPSPHRTIAVATRYHLGNTSLPEHLAMRRLASAGCDEVWIVAGADRHHAASNANASVGHKGASPLVQSQFRAYLTPDGQVRVDPSVDPNGLNLRVRA
ncbi:MAG: hypothetical protein NTU53_08585 [Planctomycetota bacterium]|nr:hypothetical protein [Planctomycetota bacterium]